MLTIQVVGWNSSAVLPETLAALSTIPRGEAVIRYIDNGSSDNSVEQVRSGLFSAEVVLLGENRGFAEAHNIGLARCTTPLVLTLDPDVTLDWVGVKELLATFNDATVGAVQGKLHRAGGKVIDSAGIVQTLALNGRERGANEIDTGQFVHDAELLAVTGACGLYRLSALRDVAGGSGNYFDQDFFAYKEDVDLGWRLNRAGWKVLYRPVLMGRHRRTLGRRGVVGWGMNPVIIWQRLRDRRTRYSLRNWVWMITKNVSGRQMLKAKLFVDTRLVLFLALSLLYWPLLSVWPEIVRGLPRMVEKRNAHEA